MDHWADSRKRAETLLARHDFATELLTLYLALLDVWERSATAARADAPDDLAAWAASRVAGQVVEVTEGAGPTGLRSAMNEAFTAPAAMNGAFIALLRAHLAGEELVPVERYLARATLRGPLAAMDAGPVCAGDPAPRGDRRCPVCGGPPQLSLRSDTGDALVSGHRKLQCARCLETWSYSASSCAYCGESGRRTVFRERSANARVPHSEHRDGPQVGRGQAAGETFPHLRLEACGHCQRYLIEVDLGRDPLAVPEVDELTALPLDLYAAEQGFSKITPNLMGV